MVVKRFAIGLDIGQAQDYTAIAIIKQIQENDDYHYELNYLERVPLGTTYAAIVDYVTNLAESSQLKANGIDTPEMVVDATGCGRPVVEMLRARDRNEGAFHLVPCSITGGSALTVSGEGFYGVPKKDLVSTLQILYQDKKLMVAKSLAQGQIFVEELLNFKVKINTATGNDSFEAWRSRDHDDMVLAVALASWWLDGYRRY
ncbi:hypothetical protein M0R72_20035 [Candidatus Pacearchaeota archaeon]|nr:hypothetical protein [Candidatus Pacearchaeota archaeon]